MSFNPDWASPPGNTIEHRMKLKNVSREALGLTEEEFHAILTGEVRITEEFAEQLSEVLGSSKIFWLKREEQYRNRLALLRLSSNWQDTDHTGSAI